MRRVWRIALIQLLATPIMAAPSWRSTPVAQWSKEDAQQFLADSPWVKKVQLEKLRNLSPFERRDGGDWDAGIPSGIGIATAGLFADWRVIEAIEHDYAVSQLGTVTVRWESATPVRAAEAKVGDSAIPGWAGDYYAIAVRSVRPPFRWNLADQLKRAALLREDTKKKLKPSRVMVLPGAGGLATFVYLFPRAEIVGKYSILGFVAQIGRLFVSVNFFPDDMRLQGRPQL